MAIPGGQTLAGDKKNRRIVPAPPRRSNARFARSRRNFPSHVHVRFPVSPCARFRLAAHELRQLPADNVVPKLAFAGRSNAGKRAHWNRHLRSGRSCVYVQDARPHAQQLVVFDLDGDRRLIDLPGYGYAEGAGPRYAITGANSSTPISAAASAPRGVVLIMDSRHPPGRISTSAQCWAWTAVNIRRRLSRPDDQGR